MPEHMAADNRDSDDTISSVSGVARSTYGVLEMQLNGTLPPRPSRKYKVIIMLLKRGDYIGVVRNGQDVQGPGVVHAAATPIIPCSLPA